MTPTERLERIAEMLRAIKRKQSEFNYRQRPFKSTKLTTFLSEADLFEIYRLATEAQQEAKDADRTL